MTMAGGKTESRWFRRGRRASNPLAPGSYGGWIRERRPPSAYPDTAWQRAIADAGRDVGKACRGKRGSEWYECRSNVMRKEFPRGTKANHELSRTLGESVRRYQEDHDEFNRRMRFRP